MYIDQIFYQHVVPPKLQVIIPVLLSNSLEYFYLYNCKVQPNLDHQTFMTIISTTVLFPPKLDKNPIR